MLIGEGDYNLNVLKEVEVTDSYLGLNQDITHRRLGGIECQVPPNTPKHPLDSIYTCFMTSVD